MFTFSCRLDFCCVDGLWYWHLLPRCAVQAAFYTVLLRNGDCLGAGDHHHSDCGWAEQYQQPPGLSLSIYLVLTSVFGPLVTADAVHCMQAFSRFKSSCQMFLWLRQSALSFSCACQVIMTASCFVALRHKDTAGMMPTASFWEPTWCAHLPPLSSPSCPPEC